MESSRIRQGLGQRLLQVWDLPPSTATGYPEDWRLGLRGDLILAKPTASKSNMGVSEYRGP